MSMGHEIVPDKLLTTEEIDATVDRVLDRSSRPAGLGRRLVGWWRRPPAQEKPPEKRYVLGFVFDAGYHHVLLIVKNRPEWMMGKLNGLGGKIAAGESPRQAMERELGEETAGQLGPVDLVPFGRLRGDQDGKRWEVWLFYAYVREEFSPRLSGIDVGEGTTFVADRADLPNWPALPNLRYLVPMAVNHARGVDRAAFFEIIESGVPSHGLESHGLGPEVTP